MNRVCVFHAHTIRLTTWIRLTTCFPWFNEVKGCELKFSILPRCGHCPENRTITENQNCNQFEFAAKAYLSMKRVSETLTPNRARRRWSRWEHFSKRRSCLLTHYFIDHFNIVRVHEIHRCKIDNKNDNAQRKNRANFLAKKLQGQIINLISFCKFFYFLPWNNREDNCQKAKRYAHDENGYND